MRYALALVCWFAVGATAAQDFEIVDLGPEGHYTEGNAANDRAEAVGLIGLGGGINGAFLWSESGGTRVLGTICGPTTTANAINDRAEVAGMSTTCDNQRRAFYWNSSDGIVDLGTLGGDESRAFGMNERGEVVGYSTTPNGEFRVLLWEERTGTIDLDIRGVANSINDWGGIAGFTTSLTAAWDYEIDPLDFEAFARLAAAFDFRAFLWLPTDHLAASQFSGVKCSATGNTSGPDEPVGAVTERRKATGCLIDLGTFGGYSTARDVNNRGEAVGESEIDAGTGVGHPFLWTAEVGMVDLGALQGFDSCGATSINEKAEVVGFCGKTNPSRLQAFYWNAQAGIVELPTLTGTDTGASGINNRGEIVGFAMTPSGERHAVIWRPVVR